MKRRPPRPRSNTSANRVRLGAAQLCGPVFPRASPTRGDTGITGRRRSLPLVEARRPPKELEEPIAETVPDAGGRWPRSVPDISGVGLRISRSHRLRREVAATAPTRFGSCRLSRQVLIRATLFPLYHHAGHTVVWPWHMLEHLPRGTPAGAPTILGIDRACPCRPMAARGLTRNRGTNPGCSS